MNAVLVTGATGFLGRQMALRLAQEGNLVHALYRTEAKLGGLQHDNIRFFRGSLDDADSISHAMEGCRQVYHMAAYTLPWAWNPRVFYDQNIGGTENVLLAAWRHGVEKLVFTSTAGVLGPSSGELNTEEKQFTGRHFTHYDRSKSKAEEKVFEFARKGLNAVVINPTRIFGPGYLSKSNAVTMMIERYLQGKWKLIPGNGKSIGNYVFVEDVVDCHLLAMQKGRSGERYLAGSENFSYNEFFELLAMVSGIKHRLYRVPVGLMMVPAVGMLCAARLTGWTPPIVPSFVRRYNQNWAVSSEKAMNELGYSPISFNQGLKKTIEWIQS